LSLTLLRLQSGVSAFTTESPHPPTAKCEVHDTVPQDVTVVPGTVEICSVCVDHFGSVEVSFGSTQFYFGKLSVAVKISTVG
jgi:hypothetical protein